MDRLKMLSAAKQMAYEAVDNNAALPDERFKKLKKFDTEEAIRMLAHGFLEGAADETES